MNTDTNGVAPELDELTITIVVDNTTDTLSSIDPGIPQLPEIATSSGHPTERPARRPRLRRRPSTSCASHATGSRRSQPHARGADHDGAVRRRPLRRSVARERRTAGHRPVHHRRAVPVALALGPLRRHHTVVAAIAAARDRAGRPPLIVDVHPDRPDQRGILTPLGIFAMLPPEPTIEAIEAAGGQRRRPRRRPRVDELFLASGDIPRQTSYETGLAGHHSWRGDQVTLDPEIHDERFLAANVRGRGTTVLTACSHAGVVNVGLEAGGWSPTSRSTSCSAATTSPAQPSRTASSRPSATSQNSSRPGSSHPGTAPAGEPPPHSPTHSARRLRPERRRHPLRAQRGVDRPPFTTEGGVSARRRHFRVDASWGCLCREGRCRCRDRHSVRRAAWANDATAGGDARMPVPAERGVRKDVLGSLPGAGEGSDASLDRGRVGLLAGGLVWEWRERRATGVRRRHRSESGERRSDGDQPSPGMRLGAWQRSGSRQSALTDSRRRGSSPATSATDQPSRSGGYWV